MSWEKAFMEMLDCITKRNTDIEVLSFEMKLFSVIVNYKDCSGEDTYWFAKEDLDLVEGVDMLEKVKNVMRLYNFNVK